MTEKTVTITWHPVRLLPYDPVKHAERFEDIQPPDEVWEGLMPCEDGQYLVTFETGFVGVDEFAIDCDECWFETEGVIAWAELPEPYVPEDDSDAKE